VWESVSQNQVQQSALNEKFLDGVDELADEFNVIKNYIEVFKGELGPETLLGSGSI
jgi:hypothetical protein